MIDFNAILTQAMAQAVQTAVDAAIQPLLVRIRVLEDQLEEQTFTGNVKKIVQDEFEITDFNNLIDIDAEDVDFTSTFESSDFEEAVRSVIRNSL
jgi:hypothetical protein